MGTEDGVLPPASQHNKRGSLGLAHVRHFRHGRILRTFCLTRRLSLPKPATIVEGSELALKAHASCCYGHGSSVHSSMGPRPGDACVRRDWNRTHMEIGVGEQLSRIHPSMPSSDERGRERGFILPRPCRPRQAIVETRTRLAHQADYHGCHGP